MNKKSTFIFIGVSGSGKSAVAEAVAKQMSVPFLDGDFLHPRTNIDKMGAGHPLNDEDREPWLEALNAAIYAMQRTHKVAVIVCSALKRKYRDVLRKDNQGLYFIYLKGNYDLIASRLQLRKDHFFKPAMLQSQFEALEEPMNNHNDIFIVDIDQTLDDVVSESLSIIKKIIE